MVATDATPTRHVLDTVPRVGFYPDVKDCGGKPWPEDFIFPSCMRAVMEFLDRPEYDYIHFMGVTGAGFFLNWKPGWHGDNVAIYYMVAFEDHLRLFSDAFDSAGLDCEVSMLKGQEALDEVEARRRIVASIDAGRPVLSHGVVGPPETSLIAGYDQGGEVLIGWSFFQAMPPFNDGLEFEPNGMFRTRNWMPQAWDLFVFGGLRQPPDPRAVRRRALQWAVKVARTPLTWGDRHNGLAAYNAWADHLLRDEEITPDGSAPPGGKDSPFSVHDDAVGVVAEGRWYASKYLARVAGEEAKMAANLYEAAACYAREHELMWQVWGCVGGNGRSPEHVKRFADPDARRRIAELVRQTRRLDEQAVGHIEKALAAEGLAP